MMDIQKNPPDNGALFLKTVADTMAAFDMVGKDAAILVGVSGGVDSVALLATLQALKNQLGLRQLGVAHLNHCLRGKASDHDAEFVEALAKKAQAPFYAQQADVAGFSKKEHLSIEEAARQLRYEFFFEIAENHHYDRIATAHHADDNAEQVLMNLLRGSGPTGLSGIPPMRGNIIRPFINVYRQDIRDFAAAHGLKFVEDQTNTDTRFLRNQVRHHLLPLLKNDYNPELSRNLNQMAEIFAAEEAWHHELVDELFDQSCVDHACLETTGTQVVLSSFVIMTLPVAAQRRLIRKVISTVKTDLRKITFEHIESIRNCLKNKDYFSLDLPDGITIVREQDDLRFLSGNAAKEGLDRHNEFHYTLLAQGPQNETVEIDEINGRIVFAVLEKEDLPDITGSNKDTAFFDADKLTYPLTVRSILPGDRISPLGLSGTQKVKDFFINNKVPRPQRAHCPVLVSGDEIIWLAGYRTSEIAKITDVTQKILRAELVIAEERTCPP